MKALTKILSPLAFVVLISFGCNNQAKKPVEIKPKMNWKDTAAKKTDTLMPRERINPEDSVRRF